MLESSHSAPADFGYAAAESSPGLTLAVYADRAALRTELRDDALESGFRVTRTESLDALVDAEPRALGDVVLVDCPVVDAPVMAALARLDLRAARTGALLIVSTALDALDAVFGCLDQSRPHILVAPSRADRLLALGRALAHQPAAVRELSDADRTVLVRLSEQVSMIGAQIEALKGRPATPDDMPPGMERLAEPSGAFRFDPQLSPRGPQAVSGRAPSLPSAGFLRKIIRHRQLRARHLPAEIFADPAWDILLDLAAARMEKARVSVSSLCIASAVPPTTALRWIGQLTDAGLLCRQEDPADRRRAFIALTEAAVASLGRYFAAIGKEAAPLV
ncbi:MAG: winged helix DNA-binding protein [Sphingomonadales bacterium]|nr:winged helix DNA-binding protein [Sphingomonadales bacterium]